MKLLIGVLCAAAALLGGFLGVVRHEYEGFVFMAFGLVVAYILLRQPHRTPGDGE